MTPDLHQRARNVLAQLSVIAEGNASRMDVEGHGAPDSRPPVSPEAIDRERDHKGCPPESKSLYDHWRCLFERAWDDRERLLYWVLLAEEKLVRIRRTPLPTYELPAGEALTDLIATSKGSPAEVAARFARFSVTMSHVRTVRVVQRRDPETGERWLWPSSDERSALSVEGRERAKEFALARARELLAQRLSQRRVCEATGIPRGTLQRMLGQDDRPTSENGEP